MCLVCRLGGAVQISDRLAGSVWHTVSHKHGQKDKFTERKTVTVETVKFDVTPWTADSSRGCGLKSEGGACTLEVICMTWDLKMVLIMCSEINVWWCRHTGEILIFFGCIFALKIIFFLFMRWDHELPYLNLSLFVCLSSLQVLPKILTHLSSGFFFFAQPTAAPGQ